MKTRSLYIIGPAGAGKSTFMQGLLDKLPPLGPLEDLHSKRNAKALVTLRGHMIGEQLGWYLGCHRDRFPGSDGLDRATSPTGEEWLRTFTLPQILIGEGSTLATRRFLAALHEMTDLQVVYLHTDPEVLYQRGQERAELLGAKPQDRQFVTATATRSANLVDWLRKQDVSVLSVDTSEPDLVEISQDLCLSRLYFGERSR